MTGELGFFFSDLYGNAQGWQTTRSQVIPEEDDQMALVDDQTAAVKNPVNEDPKQGQYIITGMIIFAIIIVAFSIV